MAIRRTACPTTSRSAFLAPMASRSSSRSISKASRCRAGQPRSEEHTSELQSQSNLVCRLLLEKKKKNINDDTPDVPPTNSQSICSLTAVLPSPPPYSTTNPDASPLLSICHSRVSFNPAPIYCY